MTVEVEIDGRLHRVELERADQRWVAIVNGHRLDVDAVPTGAGWSLLIAAPDGTPDGTKGDARASYDVMLDTRSAGESVAYVNGHAIAVSLVDPRAWRRAGRHAAGEGDPRFITSAMPGRVVKVLVKPGERVTARQGLIVVEAMKMENELRAPADAVVRDVRVIEGASVDTGAILIVLE